MSVVELIGILTIYTVLIIFIIRWLKDKVDELGKELVHAHDEIRKDHNTLSNLIARDYMDKDNTMQMYTIMSKATEQKVDAVFKKVDTMNDKLDQVLILMAESK